MLNFHTICKSSSMDKYMIKSSKYTKLKKFVEINNEEIYIPITLENPSSIINKYFGVIPGKLPILSQDFFSNLDELLNKVPVKFKCYLSISFKDKEEYDNSSLLEIINENIKFHQQNINLKTKKIIFISFALGILGCIFLCISYFFNHINLPEIIFDIINISGTFMVWEGASRLVIDRLENTRKFKKYSNMQIEIK